VFIHFTYRFLISAVNRREFLKIFQISYVICCLHLQRRTRNYGFTLKNKLSCSPEINDKSPMFTRWHIPKDSIYLVSAVRTSNSLTCTLCKTNMTTKLNKTRQETYAKVTLWGFRVSTVFMGTPRTHVAVNTAIHAAIIHTVAQQCSLRFVALPTLLQTTGRTLLSSCKLADIFFRLSANLEFLDRFP